MRHLLLVVLGQRRLVDVVGVVDQTGLLLGRLERDFEEAGVLFALLAVESVGVIDLVNDYIGLVFLCGY